MSPMVLLSCTLPGRHMVVWNTIQQVAQQKSLARRLSLSIKKDLVAGARTNPDLQSRSASFS